MALFDDDGGQAGDAPAVREAVGSETAEAGHDDEAYGARHEREEDELHVAAQHPAPVDAAEAPLDQHQGHEDRGEEELVEPPGEQQP